MKYIYKGEDNCFCIELLAYKLMPKDKLLMNGDTFDVPDDNKRVIASLDASGVFKRVRENKKVVKSKKEDK